MGIDAETAANDISQTAIYFIECCRPQNVEEIMDALNKLVFAIKDKK